jgi:hypothetical protein
MRYELIAAGNDRGSAVGCGTIGRGPPLTVRNAVLQMAARRLRPRST